jgi:excisionase family DNA binding protein
MEENNELKLYSITAAAKKLSIRKETLLDLIERGKIGVNDGLGNRRKISHLELIRYIKSSTVYINPDNNKKSSNIDSIVKKYKYAKQEKPMDEINKIFNKLKRRD